MNHKATNEPQPQMQKPKTISEPQKPHTMLDYRCNYKNNQLHQCAEASVTQCRFAISSKRFAEAPTFPSIFHGRIARSFVLCLIGSFLSRAEHSLPVYLFLEAKQHRFFQKDYRGAMVVVF